MKNKKNNWSGITWFPLLLLEASDAGDELVWATGNDIGWIGAGGGWKHPTGKAVKPIFCTSMQPITWVKILQSYFDKWTVNIKLLSGCSIYILSFLWNNKRSVMS